MIVNRGYIHGLLKYNPRSPFMTLNDFYITKYFFIRFNVLLRSQNLFYYSIEIFFKKWHI